MQHYAGRHDATHTHGCPSTPVTLTGNETCYVGAHPVNFRQTAAYALAGGTLEFDYAWDSSTGNLGDLSSCTVSERVTYPGTGSPYTWPRPPWQTATPNPTIAPTPPINGTDGAAMDDNYSGTFLKPYQAATFTATQTFNFSCGTGTLAGTLFGPLNIVRTVSKNPDGSFEYVIAKSGEQNSINPLP